MEKLAGDLSMESFQRFPPVQFLHVLAKSLSLSLPKANLTKPRKLLNPELSKKSKGVTTQIKALDEY